jgi:hypothetical protein
MRPGVLVLVADLLWPASTFAQEGFFSSGFMTANKLYDECTSGSLLCSVYVMGVSDGLIAVKPNLFCAPLDITVDQERALVVKYLRDHPETWHYSASSEVGVALKKAFPCKEQGH